MRMKKTNALTALAMAGVLSLNLVGCGATVDTDQAAEATSESSEEAATAEDADEDVYAYLADFIYGDAFDENGYITGVKASDYVTLPEDYKKLSLPVGTDVISDDDVMDYVESNILASYAETSEVTDRAAADGDTVNIDYSGTVDGEAFDGGTDEGYDLTLGSGSFIDGFEEQIVGHKPGDTFDVNVTFPDDYWSEDLAGKDAVFSCTLNYIAEEVLPELTDDWVKENFSDSLNLNSADELKEYVHKMLLDDQEYDAVYNKLLETASFSDEFPEVLNTFMENYALATPYEYSLYYGMSLDDFLKQYGYEDGVSTYLSDAAEDMTEVKQQIILMQALAEAYDMVCTDDMLTQYMEEEYGDTDYSSAAEEYGENYLRMSVLHDKVIDKLLETATFDAK